MLPLRLSRDARAAAAAATAAAAAAATAAAAAAAAFSRRYLERFVLTPAAAAAAACAGCVYARVCVRVRVCGVCAQSERPQGRREGERTSEPGCRAQRQSRRAGVCARGWVRACVCECMSVCVSARPPCARAPGCASVWGAHRRAGAITWAPRLRRLPGTACTTALATKSARAT